MNFKEFKQATQRFNVLKRSDIAGCYHFATATVSFESLNEKDFQVIKKAHNSVETGKCLSGPTYDAMAKVLPLAVHEYTHFIDSTSTVWGMRLLSRMNAAYSSSDRFQKDVEQFWQAKQFYDFLRSIALPDYYTLKSGYDNTLPWRASISAGQIFDKEGRITDRSILFQWFENSSGVPLVRSPISNVSILEASAMAQEIAYRLSLVTELVDDFRLVEERDISRRMMAYIYNPDLTEYSVCVHLAANMLRTSDIGSAFTVSAVLSRVCLNLTDEAFDKLAADESLMQRAGLPGNHDFSRRIFYGLRNRDLGTAFFLMTQCLSKQKDLTQADAEKVARLAIEAVGIEPESIHSGAISYGERIEYELRDSPIEPIRCLAEAGLKNLTMIDPLKRSFDFGRLHLPRALLGDSTERFVLGDPNTPLGGRTVDSIFEPLFDGESWINRFAEGCL